MFTCTTYGLQYNSRSGFIYTSAYKHMRNKYEKEKRYIFVINVIHHFQKKLIS
jgi:hypothetical protein